MAYPQVAATNTSSSVSGTSHVVSLPSGISVGDLLLVFYACDGDNSITDWDGFTELFSMDDGSQIFLAVGYKIATGSDTLTITTANSESAAHISYRITGHHDSVMPEVSTGVNSNSSNPDPDSLTPTNGPKEFLWIAVEGNDDVDATSVYPLPDNNLSKTSGTGNKNCHLSVCSDELEQASLDPGTFTIAAGEQWVACTVAVHPEGGTQTYSGSVTDGVKLGDTVSGIEVETIDVVDGAKLGDVVAATVYAGQVNDTVTPSAQETEVTLYGDPETEVILGQQEELSAGIAVYDPTVISQPPLEIPPLLVAGAIIGGTIATKTSITQEQTEQREAQVTLNDPSVLTPPERVVRDGVKAGDIVDVVETILPESTEGIKLGDTLSGTIAEEGNVYTGTVVDGIYFGDIVEGTVRERIESEITEGVRFGDILAPTYEGKTDIVDGFKVGEIESEIKIIRQDITERIKLGELEYEDIQGSYSADLPEGIRLGDIIDGTLTLYSDIVDGIHAGEIADAKEVGVYEGDIVDGILFGELIATEEATQYTCTVVDGLRMGDNSLGIESGGDFILDAETYGAETSTPHEFTSITTGGSNKYARSTSAANFGLACYKAQFYGSSAIAYGRKDFTAVTDRYYRAYFYLPSGFSGTANRTTNIVSLYDGSDILVGFGIQSDGTGAAYRWSVQLYGSAPSSTNFSLGAWHRVDIHWKAGSGADGGAQVWVDGDSILSLFTLDHSSYAADNLRCGIVSTAFIPDNGEYAYFDDIKGASSYIGAYSPSVPFPRAQMTEYSSALDGFCLGDVASRLRSEARAIVDGIRLGEIESETLTLRPELTEGLKLGDVVATVATLYPVVLDGVKLGDLFEELTRQKVVITFDSEKATITFAAETPTITFSVANAPMTFRVGVRGEMS